jgi:hypothetical protein
MTGATGNLTPEGSDEEFIPAETREMSDPQATRQVTSVIHRRAGERHAQEIDAPGHLIERGEHTAPNERDGGYGSSHGLSADDPAYREEEHAAPDAVDTAGGRPPHDIEIGGDEGPARSEEHF